MSYTAQNVIKTFMTTLDTTSSTGLTALNEAVAACSSFSSASDWISSFTAACKSAISAGETSTEILSSLCGINLTNTDTGAITGSDAGTSTTKTAASIIAEDGTASSPSGTASTINNLLVTWPTTSYNNGSLTSTEKYIIANLNTWWIPESLSLLTESYGMSFSESGTSVNAINVQFVYEANSGTLAYTSWRSNSSTDKATSLTLSINMYYYNNINTSDNNGSSSTASGYYLDRVIAHELTHALMAANLNYSTMSDLPLFITEGLAELVGGIDDERSSDISYLISNTSALSSALSLTSDGEYYSYAAGYMALRYLAKYGSSSATPTTTTAIAISDNTYYNSDYTSITITGNSNVQIWLDGRDGTSYKSTVSTLDATDAAGAVVLAGSTRAELLEAGSGSTSLWGGAYTANDTMIGGSGSDTFYYGTSEGNDIIEDMSSSDKIFLYDISRVSSVGRSSSNSAHLVISADTSNAATIIDSGDSDQLYHYTMDGSYTGSFKAANYTADTLSYDTETEYFYGSLSSNTANTTTISVSGSTSSVIYFDGRTGQYYANNITRLDASGSTGTNILAGGDSADSILAGTGDTSLWGGAYSTSDTMIGGSGSDTFYYGTSEGNDIIENMSSSDKIFLYDISRVSSVGRSAGDATHLTIAADASNAATIIDSGNSNQLYHYTMDGSYTGSFKAAKYTADTLTYDTSTEYFYGSLSTDTANTTTITVTGSTNSIIYFDGRTGQYYANNITHLDASTSTGSNILAGGNDADSIIAGQGSSSLWGGAGTSSDTLQGGSGADVFYYGANEGSDFITQGSSTDKVLLYSDYDPDFRFIGLSLSNNDLTLNMNTGTLTISNWSANTLNTFQFSDGSQYKAVQTGSSITLQAL